jgi:hypothetical protein
MGLAVTLWGAARSEELHVMILLRAIDAVLSALLWRAAAQ